MKDTHHISRSPSETAKYSKKCAREFSGGEIIALYGDLGSGKTTFCQGVLKALGARGPFTSPTFNIIKQYDLEEQSYGYKKGLRTVYHIDAYRVSIEDMIELGWNEFVNEKKAIILVEWPEKIAPLIPGRSRNLLFETISEKERKITENCI